MDGGVGDQLKKGKGVGGCYSACMHSVGVRAGLLYGHVALLMKLLEHVKAEYGVLDGNVDQHLPIILNRGRYTTVQHSDAMQSKDFDPSRFYLRSVLSLVFASIRCSLV